MLLDVIFDPGQMMGGNGDLAPDHILGRHILIGVFDLLEKPACVAIFLEPFRNLDVAHRRPLGQHPGRDQLDDFFLFRLGHKGHLPHCRGHPEGGSAEDREPVPEEVDLDRHDLLGFHDLFVDIPLDPDQNIINAGCSLALDQQMFLFMSFGKIDPGQREEPSLQPFLASIGGDRNNQAQLFAVPMGAGIFRPGVWDLQRSLVQFRQERLPDLACRGALVWVLVVVSVAAHRLPVKIKYRENRSWRSSFTRYSLTGTKKSV